MLSFPRASAISGSVLTLESTGSTNAELRARAEGLGDLAVVVTDDQTAGRGRLDRTWHTPPGSALAISVLLRDLPTEPGVLGWIPLVAGAAMADAIAAQLPKRRVGVKWPNDVLVDGQKICGILAEVAGRAVIVGAGVNTRMRTTQLPVPTATSFAVLGAEADADRLVSDWLTRLDALRRMLLTDAARAADVVSERCVTLGLDVRAELPDGSVLEGTAVRLDADGRLVLAVDGSERAISAGDVVHARLAQ